MTKSNKIMLCLLLAVTLTCAVALTALSVTPALTAHAANAEKTYTKVTSAQTDWSGNYIIVYEKVDTKANTTTPYVFTGVDSATGGSETTTLQEDGSIKMAPIAYVGIAALTGTNAGKYSIKIVGGTNDGKYIGHSASSNGMNVGETADTNSISIDDNSNVTITGASNATLKFNDAANQMRFRYYVFGQQAIQLYKEAPSCEHTWSAWTFDYEARTKSRTCQTEGGCGQTETVSSAVSVTVNGTAITDFTSTEGMLLGTFTVGNKTLNAEILLADSQTNICPKDEVTLDVTLNGSSVLSEQSGYTVILDETGGNIFDSSDGSVLVGDTATTLAFTVTYTCPTHGGEGNTQAVANNDGTHKVNCATCGQTLEGQSAVACSGGTATCSAKATCTVCNAQYGQVASHDYTGTGGVCTMCGYTADENLVLEAYKLARGATLAGGSHTLTGVITSIDDAYSSQYNNVTVTIQVGSLTDNPIKCYRLAGGETLAVGNKITVTGEITNYNDSSIQFTAGATYVLAPTTQGEFNVTQSFAAVDGGSTLESKTTGEGESATTTNTLYVASNGTIKVVYTIAKNDSINGLQATLVYPGEVFEFVSAESGVYTLTVTGTATTAESIKIAFDGIDSNESYNATATGILVTVTYKLKADVADTVLQAVTADNFGLTIDQAVVIGTGNAQVNVGTSVDTTTNTVSFDKIKTASIKVNEVAADGTVTVTYNAKALTVGLELTNNALVVSSESSGQITATWYSDSARTTTIDAPKNVGTYYLTVAITESAQYADVSANFTVVIDPYQIDYDEITVTATPSEKALQSGKATWAEGDIKVNVGTLPEAASNVYTITYGTLEFTTTGTHDITVKVELNSNYKFVSTASFATGDSETVYNGKVTVTVSAKAITLSGIVDVDRYYDGTAIDLSGITATVEESDVTVSLEIKVNNVVVTGEALKNTIKNAGDYTIAVRAWVAGSTDYSEVTGDAAIKIRQLTLSFEGVSITYSGSTVSWTAVTKAYGADETQLVDITTTAFSGLTLTYQVTNGTVHGDAITGENLSFDASTVEWTAALSLKVTASDTTNFIAGSTDLATLYQVTFTSKEGDPAVSVATQKVFAGQTATEPSPAPSQEGYRFVCWQIVDGETATNFDFTTAITAHTTLTAKWVEVWTITWNNNDDTTITTQTVDVAENAKVSRTTAPDYQGGDNERFHYTWTGWKVGETAYGTDAEIPVSGNTTITATFEITHKTFFITFVVKKPSGEELQRVVTATCEVDQDLERYTQDSYLQAAMAQRPWHTLSAWQYNGTEVADMDALVAIVPTNVYQITLTAQHILSVGKGNVNGDAAVNVNDISLYRQYIVGGYAITAVEAGSEWTTANAEGYSAEMSYFLKSVAKLDSDDEHEDVRDVVVIRMALVGGYGWKIESGAIVVDSGSSAPAGGEGQQQSSRQQALPITLGGRKFEQE